MTTILPPGLAAMKEPIYSSYRTALDMEFPRATATPENERKTSLSDSDLKEKEIRKSISHPLLT
jgi:hypothetical protein